MNKVKNTKLKLPVLVRPLSAIVSHPLTLTSPGHRATLGTQRSSLLGETIPVQPLTVCRNMKLAQSAPSQGTNSFLGKVEPWRYIFFLLKAILCELKICLYIDYLAGHILFIYHRIILRVFSETVSFCLLLIFYKFDHNHF